MNMIIMLDAALNMTVYNASKQEISHEVRLSCYLAMNIVGLVLLAITGVKLYRTCVAMPDINVATPYIERSDVTTEYSDFSA